MKVFHTDTLAFNLAHSYSAFFFLPLQPFLVPHTYLYPHSLVFILNFLFVSLPLSSKEAPSRVGNEDKVSKYLGHSLPLL